MNERKSFVMYMDWYEVVSMLDDKQAGALVKALYEFEVNGKVPKLDQITAVAFTVMKSTLERDRKKWEETTQKRRENGLKGGRPKKANGFSQKQTEAKKADNVNENVSDNDNESDNASVSKNESVSVNDASLSKFERVELSEAEKQDLIGQSDRLTVERYILKIIDWQKKNRKLNSKPYISIRRWFEEDGVKPKPQLVKNEGGISVDEYDAFARSIDFDKLSTK
ncbi:MAG: hypothetical protein IJM75_07935 [Ruminococcus sp.]|nr:hypothetical protein [Ruminococcus sp.]